MKYILLITALCGMVSCGSSTTSGTQPTATDEPADAYQNINALSAQPMLADPEVVTIDVRMPDEVEKGYIEGADLFIDLFGDFRNEVAELDTSMSYLVYCASGGRSEDACQKMSEMGFRHLYNLEGGVEGWPGKLVSD